MILVVTTFGDLHSLPVITTCLSERERERDDRHHSAILLGDTARLPAIGRYCHHFPCEEHLLLLQFLLQDEFDSVVLLCCSKQSLSKAAKSLEQQQQQQCSSSFLSPSLINFRLGQSSLSWFLLNLLHKSPNFCSQSQNLWSCCCCCCCYFVYRCLAFRNISLVPWRW